MPTMIWIMLFLVRILTLRIGHENHVGVQAQLVTDLLSTPKNGSNVNQPLHNGRYPHYHHLYLQSSSTQRLNQIENDDEEEINVKGFGDKEYRPGSNEPSNNQNQRFDFKYTEQIMNNHNEIGNISSSRVKKRLSEAHQHQIYSDVDGIAGQLVRLPCYVRTLGPSDSISLVLWYRGEDISGTPIYSVDARYTPFENAQHFVQKQYQKRETIIFRLNQAELSQTDPLIPLSTIGPKTSIQSKPISSSTAHLYMKPVEEDDGGLYWCRVDYKWERTTISIVTMNVIVPPRQLQIHLKSDSNQCRNNNGCPLNNNQTITLNEDSSATLVCSSEGGKPLPILNWYRNDELIRNEIFHSLTQNNRSLQSELHLTQIHAYNHNVIFKCLSSNDNHTFLSSQIRLKVNTKPSQMEMKFVNTSHASMMATSFLAGSQVTAICRSYGSRPAANHTWFIMPGERVISVLKQNVFPESQITQSNDWTNNAINQWSSSSSDDILLVTESIAQFMVQPEDNGHHLVCRAVNTLLANNSVDYSLQLNVSFAPKVTLHQLEIESKPLNQLKGKTLHGSTSMSVYSIRGSDLHLRCNITANPSADQVVWYRNSYKLTVDDSNLGQLPIPVQIIENGTHLIVPNVTDDWQGFYQCVAHNQHGSGFSNQLQVQILHKPNCMTPTQTIPASVGSVVTMICDVSANPANVTFFWHTKHTDLDRYEHSYDGGGYGDDQSHPSSHYIINDKGLKSRLEVRIENGDDFGQYSCWAKNYAGTQEEPCYYNVYEHMIKQQLLCETNITHQAIYVQCQRESANPQLFPLNVTKNRAFDVTHHTKSILFNLKIFKNKQQLINLTSIEPSFIVAANELRTKSDINVLDDHLQQKNAEMNDSSDQVPEPIQNGTQYDQYDETMYMMLISAMVNGRQSSDVSISFKVPDQPETNAIVDDQLDIDKDDINDIGHHQVHNVSISRYKKIYPLNESHESKDTNAASFTTAASIKQLPLIWILILGTIIMLVVLILIVLTRIHLTRKRTRHNTYTPSQNSDKRFDEKSLSSKENLIEETEKNANLPVDKEAIQLFTLTNFDPTYDYTKNGSIESNYSGMNHVNLRTTLPDLMTDALAVEQVPMQEYEMETSQHNLYIIQKASLSNGPTHIIPSDALCHNIVNFSQPQYSNQIEAHQFQTLPNNKSRTSMRIALQADKNNITSCKRTPSVDAIDLVGWIEPEHIRFDLIETGSLVRTYSNDGQFVDMQSFSNDLNTNHV